MATGTGSDSAQNLLTYAVFACLQAVTIATSSLVVLRHYYSVNSFNQNLNLSYHCGLAFLALSTLVLISDAFRRIKKSLQGDLAISKS